MVVYYSIEGGPKAREIAEEAANKLKELFKETYGSSDIETEIVLEQCTAVSDSKITLADLRKVDQWRLEHISLGEEPVGAFVSISDVPN